MLCFLPYKSTLLKRGTGDARIFATILRMSPYRNFVPLFHRPAGQIAPLLLHCLNICSPQVFHKLAISHFASSNEKMLAANSATQGCDKVARKGRKIEQNEVPKPGPQNRQSTTLIIAYEDDIVLMRLCFTLWISYYIGRKTTGIQLYLADLHCGCRTEHSILH